MKAASIKIDDMINNEMKMNGRRSCSMIPDKIIPATTIQAISKVSEVMHKAADNFAFEKTLCPSHPGVAKPMRQRSAATLIIVRIKMSTIRSLTGRILVTEVCKVREMMTAMLYECMLSYQFSRQFYHLTC